MQNGKHNSKSQNTFNIKDKNKLLTRIVAGWTNALSVFLKIVSLTMGQVVHKAYFILSLLWFQFCYCVVSFAVVLCNLLLCFVICCCVLHIRTK